MDPENEIPCFVPILMRPQMSEDEEEYLVEDIKHHMEFEKLLQRALDGKAKFSPSTIEGGDREHSKYVYLVHWKGYQKFERTWEPEINLKDVGVLKEYKAAHNLPEHYETFKHLYENHIWRKLCMAAERVEGYRYLLSPKEKEAEKNKERERKEKLGNLSDLAIKKKEKPRERIRTPDDTEEIMKRKKKEREAEKKSSGVKKERAASPVPKKKPEDRPSTSNQLPLSTLDNNNFMDTLLFKKHGDYLPGIQPLDTKTPKIQKKKSENVMIDGRGDSLNGASDDPTSRPSLKIKVTRPVLEGVRNSSDSEINLNPVYLESRDSMEIEVKKEKNLGSKKEKDRISKKNVDKPKESKKETELQKATKELARLTTKLKKYPIKIEAHRIIRPHSYAINLQKFRRCRSEENLSDFFSRNSDLEVFSKNFEMAVMKSDGKPDPPIIKVYPEEDFLNKNMTKSKVNDLSRILEGLAEDNIIKIKDSFKNITYDKNFHKLLDLLVVAYSKDDSIRFKQIFLNNFPKGHSYDCHRYAAIVLIIAHCKHYQWKADPKLLSIVESDDQQMFGNIRQQQVLCSENHRKCSWMRVFFEVMPERYRFLETSGRCLTGEQADDGPFRDDVYIHCMQKGAECQKRLFFEFAKPIGFQEFAHDGYNLDAMHFLAIQYGNIQRIPSYMSIGGLDLNALATHLTTKRVIRLHEYLKEWIEKNVSNTSDDHRVYYSKLLELIGFTNESLKFFIETELKSTIFRRMDGRWKVAMELTYSHILRCSPHNNDSIGGDGNQVLSCLFQPGGISYKDGLETEETEENKENLEKLKVLRKKFQKLVLEGKGRLIVVLYRTDILYEADVQKKYAVPQFNLVRNDDGFTIKKMALLRQIEIENPELVDIAMIEMKILSSPGCRYFCVEKSENEKNLIVPGNAHIEVKGEFNEPMTFVTQAFFLKHNF